MQFLYLILSIYFGRKNPLFFLIFPIAIMQGPGALIDPRTELIPKGLFILTNNIYKDIIIVYLFVIVIFLSKKINYRLLLRSPMWFYALYILLLALYTFVSYGNAYEAINVTRLFIYMPLGFFLILLVLSSARESQFIQFINVLLWANVIGSFLYVLNSSKILPVFDTEILYSEVEFGDDTFVRDFNTIPIFSNFFFIFSIASILLKDINFNKKAIYFTVITYPFVLLYTFTRSLLLATVVESAIVILILLIYKPITLFKSKLIPILIGGLCLFGVIKTIFKSEFGYYNERVESAVQEGKNESNVDVRIQYNEKAFFILKREGALPFGYALNKRFESEMEQVGAWTADSTIPYLLIYTGVLGTIMFYLVNLWFVYKSFFCFIKTKNAFPLALFAYLIFSLISSMIMGGQPWGSPLFYLYQALVIYLIHPKKYAKSINHSRNAILQPR